MTRKKKRPISSKPRVKFGWMGPKMADEENDRLGHMFMPFFIAGQTQSTENKRVVIWELEKKVNGSWFNNHAQEIGDCVSWGGKHATEATALVEIYLKGEQEKFHRIFAPYYYGCSRCMPEGGNGRLSGDGSLGSWHAATVLKYGTLAVDDEGVPRYSGAVAKNWGRDKNAFSKFIPIAEDNIFQAAARLRSVEQVRDAIVNGYGCTTASMVGYKMQLQDRNGKSWFVGSDRWPHQMAIGGYDPEPEPCFSIKNSWGTRAHGKQLDGPDGTAWITADQLDAILRSNGSEIFAFSGFKGFPEQSSLWHVFF